MPRTALIVAYNGRPFHGWQYQDPAIVTVQQELTRAVAQVANSELVLYCAGRTDTGVHATKQVVHFDTAVVRPDKAWVMGVNAHLSNDISVQWAGPVADDFDARRTATARRYLYLIHNDRVRSAVMHGYLTRDRRQLDVARMHEAAQALVGENDFSSFRSSKCQSVSPMRHISHVLVTRRQDVIAIDIQGNAFLHHMVRNIAGTLMDIGAGVKPVEWMTELLGFRDRTAAGVTAPPDGLYLIDVQYPVRAGIPAGPNLPHFLQVHGQQA